MNNEKFKLQAMRVLLPLLISWQIPVLAQGERVNIDWSKLNLTGQQTKQIDALEQQWQRSYGQLKPSLTDDQRKIAKLLGTHGSDPIEIMALQAVIARKREQLSALAMENYLKKREILNDGQQRALEILVRQIISDREQSSSGGTTSQAVPDRIQGLMQRARNAWASEGEH